MRTLSALLLAALVAGLLAPMAAHAQDARRLYGVDAGGNQLVEFEFDADFLIVAEVAFPAPGFSNDIVLSADGTSAYVANGAGGVWKADLTTSPPTIDPTPIGTSNAAGDLALSPDGRFLVVADIAASGAPVSVVDLEQDLEVSTFDVATGDHGFVAWCDNQTDVLIGSFRDQTIYRALFDPDTGTLSNSGESLAFPDETALLNADCAPGSRTGVAVGLNALEARSFAVDGMIVADRIDGLAANDVQVGTLAGGVVVVNFGTPLPGSVQSYEYDPETGLFGDQRFNVPVSNDMPVLGADQLDAVDGLVAKAGVVDVNIFDEEGDLQDTISKGEYNVISLAIGPLVGKQAGLEVTITPEDPPVVVKRGDDIRFTVRIENKGDEPRRFDWWLNILGDTQGSDLKKNLRTLTLQPGGVFEEALTKRVPRLAPFDDYTMFANAGRFPSSIEAQDSFRWKIVEAMEGPEPDLHMQAWDDPASDTPERVVLEANYPDPFNPTTTIRFALAEPGPVRLTVYDLLGREVSRLVDGPLGAGAHEARFDAAGLANGLYLYRLEAAGEVHTRRMTLIK